MEHHEQDGARFRPKCTNARCGWCWTIRVGTDRVDKAEIDSGKCAGVSGAMAERRMALERGLRQGAADDKTIRGGVFPTHAILRKVSADLSMAEFDGRHRT